MLGTNSSVALLVCASCFKLMSVSMCSSTVAYFLSVLSSLVF